MVRSNILIASLLLSSAAAFAPSFVSRQSETALSMFGGGKKKAPPKKGDGKMDQNVFGGRGKKITVRVDEDNAMWIDEDDKGNRVSALGGKGKGK